MVRSVVLPRSSLSLRKNLHVHILSFSSNLLYSDEYVLYVNGHQFGAGAGSNGPQYFTITDLQGTNKVFAISTTNNSGGGPAVAFRVFLVVGKYLSITSMGNQGTETK